VLVEDGQTLVLGGLIDDQINDSQEKVPLLGDIPVLGNLFRFRSTTKNKRNLMVFLHPTILRDVETADFYSRGKYQDLRGAQLAYHGDELISNIAAPLLPELHLYYQGEPVTGEDPTIGTLVPSTGAAPVDPDDPARVTTPAGNQ